MLYAVKNGQEDGDYLSHRMTDSLLSALDKGCVLVEPSSPDDLSTRELNDLVYRARGVDACVSRIEGYSGVGRSFASVRELLDAIQQHGKDDSHLAYKEQSNLLRVIRSTDVLVKERADSNGDKEGYSSRDRARKRGKDRDRDTSSHIRPHPHELDKIAAAGGGVGPCMEGLQKFKDFNQSFFSIDSLCKALKKVRGCVLC